MDFHARTGAVPGPTMLRCDGMDSPLGVGAEPPVLSWGPSTTQSAAQVRVESPEGAVIWDSGKTVGGLPEIRYAGPELTSRARLNWRVRVWDSAGSPSRWSQPGCFEVGLLQAADWTASWIAREVSAALRPHRAVTGTATQWAVAGDVLEQPVPTPRGTSVVAADLRERGNAPFTARLELAAADGCVLAARDVVEKPVPLDHFALFLPVTGEVPAEGCVLRLTVLKGHVGWRSAPLPQPAGDDGISPIPVRAPHRRNGREQKDVLLVGVEVPAAADPVFATSFELDAEPVAARLYATGLGYGRFEVNGRQAGDATLEPAQTDYDRRVLYAVHDVTGLLRKGRNMLSAALGRGFWSTRGGDTWGWHLAPWNREPQLVAQLEILDAHGRRMIVASDGSWRTRAGEVTSDILYSGILQRPGHAPKWKPAVIAPPPGGVLQPTALPPVRREPQRIPVAVREAPSGGSVFDFGAVLAGRIRCRIGATGPGELLIRYGELITEDGTVVCENPFAAGPAQTDRVVFEASLQSTPWEPDFTYKGFRYVEIIRTGGAHAENVEAVPLHNDVPAAGSFECDNEILTWIDGALGRTFANNLHGIPTDTPAYEKNGWTADAHLGVTGALHHHQLRWALGKWMDDHADAQLPDGGIPQIIPTPGWGLATDPAWGASAVLIPWDLYWEYGDKAELAKRLPMMMRYADHTLRRVQREGCIWRAHGWGDWLSPGHHFPPEGAEPTSTMMLLRTMQRVADACAELGRKEDTARYREAVSRLAAAYHAEYFDPVARHYTVPGVGYRQAMNVLPLAFDAVPAEVVADVFGSLEADLEHRTGGHLDCGALSVKHLLPVLDTYGRTDLAIGVAVQPTRPAWNVWRAAGDTLWESWDPDARSRNHYFLGSIASWIQQRIGGLRCTAPGWERVDIAPVDDRRVTRAHIRHDTVRGVAEVEWSRTETKWQFHVTMPSGAIATIRVPGAEAVAVGEGRHDLVLKRAPVAA